MSNDVIICIANLAINPKLPDRTLFFPKRIFFLIGWHYSGSALVVVSVEPANDLLIFNNTHHLLVGSFPGA